MSVRHFFLKHYKTIWQTPNFWTVVLNIVRAENEDIQIKLACYQSSLTWTQPEAKSTSSTSSSAALQETGSIALPKVEKRHRNQQNTDQSLLSKREILKINTWENFWYGFGLLVSLPVFWERWFCKSPQAFFGLKLLDSAVQWLGLVLRVSGFALIGIKWLADISCGFDF